MASLDPGEMDDFGMYAWAAIITAVTLAASYFVALWWQRRRDARKNAGAPRREE